MESIASDWSSTSDSDSSSDNDEPEEQETQSTIEPLSPDFRGRAWRKRSEDGKEEGETANEEKADMSVFGAEEERENKDSETPRIGRGGGGDVGPYYRNSGGRRLGKNDSSEHLLGAKSSLENSPADSPLKRPENTARE